MVPFVIIITALILVILVSVMLSKRVKGKGKIKEGKLPFQKKYPYPYKERPLTDEIAEYLEGEQLYLSGKRGQAKLIWGRLAKKGNIDSISALIC